MKKYPIIISFITFVLLISNFGFGQKVGVSFGTGVFSGDFESGSTPKNVTGHLYLPFPLNPNLTLNVSVGYGIGNYLSETDLDQGDDSEFESSTKGLPIEGEILYFKPLLNESSLQPFLGIGAGFYNYTTLDKYKQGSEVEEDEKKISGLAQYFTFGLKMDIDSNLSAFLQFKKLGVSLIRSEYDLIDYDGDKYGTRKRDVVAWPGIFDLGIALGIRFNI